MKTMIIAAGALLAVTAPVFAQAVGGGVLLGGASGGATYTATRGFSSVIANSTGNGFTRQGGSETNANANAAGGGFAGALAGGAGGNIGAALGGGATGVASSNSTSATGAYTQGGFGPGRAAQSTRGNTSSVAGGIGAGALFGGAAFGGALFR